MQKTLVVLTGPTGVGKTELSLSLAERLGTHGVPAPIINADSRQIYRELPIGTAAPTAAEQARVKHYFVGTHTLGQDYNAGMFERDALQLLSRLFQERDIVLMVGGAMMYIDAVCKGLDDIPQADATLREQLQEQYEANGIEWLQQEIQRLDPAYWQQVDQQNPQRLMHALEVCLASGQPFSSFRTGVAKQRPFRIVKIGLTRPRAQLYERINARVLQMMHDGLEQEARQVLPFRNANSLQTVGYREMFAHFDGEYDLNRAVELIQQNSRHYAKRQLTWYNRDPEMHWFDLSQPLSIDDVLLLIRNS